MKKFILSFILPAMLVGILQPAAAFANENIILEEILAPYMYYENGHIQIDAERAERDGISSELIAATKLLYNIP